MRPEKKIPDPTTIAGIAATITGITAPITGFADRIQYLRALREHYSPALVQALVARAHKDIRRDPNEAAQCARLAQVVAREIGDVAGRVAALRALAQASVLIGCFARALTVLDAATTAAKDLDDETQLAELEALRIYPLIHLERYDEARATGRSTLTFFERTGKRAGMIRVRMALADLALRLDDPRKALRHYNKVEELITPETPERFRGVLAVNRAVALEARNRFRAAARQLAQARDLFEKTGCDHSVAQVEYNQAYAEALRGNYDLALHLYAQTEEAFVDLGDERHLALIDLERAEIHVNLNMPVEASALAASAEERFASLGMEKDCAMAAQLAGRAALLSGHTVRGERSLLRAQEIFEKLGLAERQGACLVQRALIAMREECDEEARRLLDRADVLLDPETNPLSAASVELSRARLHLKDGEPRLALRCVGRMRAASRRIHAPWLHVEAFRLMAWACMATEQLDEALVAYKHAIDELERYRGGVPPDEYMASFLAGHSALYEEIVSLLVRMGHAELAFDYTERAKSRALVDLLADRARGKMLEPRTSWSALRVAHLRERLNASYQRIFRHTTGREQRSARALQRARSQACELEEEMARLLREARLRDPEAASLVTVDTPNLKTVRRDLAPDTVLIEYMVTPTELLIFLVARDAYRVVRQEVSSDELRRLIQRFRFHLAKFDLRSGVAESVALDATRANLAKLAGHLLAPLADSLDARRLVIVPHGVVHNLPIHALPWGDGWVADRFEVVYAPSAAVYGYCSHRPVPAPGPDCIFGLPDDVAPEIEREVRRVARALDSDSVYVGENATLARLQEHAARARILHVATHGMFSPEQPMLSSIRLADTWLNLYDIYDLDLQAELVVLSACESGVADVTNGDEILGLTRGFLYAGARALLASQWRVNDETTAEFMDTFYRCLQESGDAAGALKDAMAETRARKPHPYYWAPFFLTGSPTHHLRRRPAEAVVTNERNMS